MSTLRDEFYNRILFLVQEYANDEECFGDAAQLRINPKTLDAELIDDPDEDSDQFDYYQIVEFLKPNVNGSFEPDPESVSEIADTYIPS